MRDWSKGVTWVAPNHILTTKQHADSYVDDTTLFLNGIPKVQQLKQQMQHNLTAYQDMLVWARGALTLSKCFFSIMDWTFTPDGLPKLNTDQYAL